MSSSRWCATCKKWGDHSGDRHHEPTEQLALPLGAFVVPEPDPTLTLDERFEAFHAANPWVEQAIIALLDDAQHRGMTRFGVKAAFEVLRWRWGRATYGDAWKLNNSLTSRYARHILERRPDLAPMIELRKLRAA